MGCVFLIGGNGGTQGRNNTHRPKIGRAGGEAINWPQKLAALPSCSAVEVLNERRETTHPSVRHLARIHANDSERKNSVARREAIIPRKEERQAHPPTGFHLQDWCFLTLGADHQPEAESMLRNQALAPPSSPHIPDQISQTCSPNDADDTPRTRRGPGPVPSLRQCQRSSVPWTPAPLAMTVPEERPWLRRGPSN